MCSIEKSKSAFQIFCGDVKPQIKETNPDMKSADVTKELKTRWEFVKTDSKRFMYYNEEAKKDKERFEKEKRMLTSKLLKQYDIGEIKKPVVVYVPVEKKKIEKSEEPKLVLIEKTKPLYEPLKKLSDAGRVYVSPSQPNYNIISSMVRQTHKNACILFVEEVHNSKLQAEHEQLYETIKKTRGFCERMEMFHGTKAESIDAIVREGFMTKYNKCSAYGLGTYIAKEASYSFHYMQPGEDKISYMFLCDVLLGVRHQYASGRKIDTTKHDNSVDHLKNPTIVVTPYDAGCMPIYVIAFHKNAK